MVSVVLFETKHVNGYTSPPVRAAVTCEQPCDVLIADKGHAKLRRGIVFLLQLA